MSKCERCYHNKVCIDGANYKNVETCNHFKDKELIAELHHGEWKINCDGYYPYCSECGNEPTRNEMTNYCSQCGAKMSHTDKCRVLRGI